MGIVNEFCRYASLSSMGNIIWHGTNSNGQQWWRISDLLWSWFLTPEGSFLLGVTMVTVSSLYNLWSYSNFHQLCSWSNQINIHKSEELRLLPPVLGRVCIGPLWKLWSLLVSKFFTFHNFLRERVHFVWSTRYNDNISSIFGAHLHLAITN